MKVNVAGLVAGIAFGFILSWARASDPTVIRDMLLLREPDMFLLMGSAIVVAAVGIRVLRRAGLRALTTGEPIAWSVQQPERRHVLGSAMFGVGWSLACTCPGPMAAMIGEGHLQGLWVASGLLVGVALQPVLVRRPSVDRERAAASGAAVGL
jgi:uncharacterized protein